MESKTCPRKIKSSALERASRSFIIHRFQDKELSWQEPAESLWNYCSEGASGLLEASDGCQKTSTLKL